MIAFATAGQGGCAITDAIATDVPIRAGRAPRFTIVTSTFNAAASLPRTARSLAGQTCRDFEWVVVDGASTDGTAEVARGFGDLVARLVSEPDSGIYDAWNKVLPLVRGEWVLFLGAGDTLYADDVLERVSAALDSLSPGTTTAYGDVTVFDPATGEDTHVRNDGFQGLDGPWRGGRPVLPCHQGVFHHAKVFDGFRFDQRCRISADNELLLRELLAGRGARLELMVARFEAGGISAQPAGRLRMVCESVYINWKLGIFWRRAPYQLAVLGINALLHPLRLLRARS
ncbi:glycosyltransferase family 2 protein [Cognatiluteimonas lumbrici]|uniref:glycosyltransferase family 2 protein n=1 Tax=Cognatiluteimonas lumbrici TaxID=2559601 RepID=UPI00112ED40A|nr:glycosyltransferase family 2 protein [Luteimonas lumbrici]